MSKLLIDEQPLQVLPSLANLLGLNKAIFLQQVHYWLQKSEHIREGKRWIYNTYSEWQEQFPFWSIETIKRTVRSLEADGVVETTDRFNRYKMDHTKWYTIDYETLDLLYEEVIVTPSGGQVDTF